MCTFKKLIRNLVTRSTTLLSTCTNSLLFQASKKVIRFTSMLVIPDKLNEVSGNQKSLECNEKELEHLMQISYTVTRENAARNHFP